MRFDSEAVMGMLHGLSQQVTRYRHHASSIEVLMGRSGDQLNGATEEMRSAHDEITALIARLQRHVVPRDGLGDTYESMSELILRARRVVIITETGRLRDAARGSRGCGYTDEWFAARPIGRFRTMDDVAAFFYEQLHQINCMWMPYRRHDRRGALIHDAVRVTLYRKAIRVAQRAVCELREDADLTVLMDRKGFEWIASALSAGSDAEPDWHFPAQSQKTPILSERPNKIIQAR